MTYATCGSSSPFTHPIALDFAVLRKQSNLCVLITRFAADTLVWYVCVCVCVCVRARIVHSSEFLTSVVTNVLAAFSADLLNVA